VTTVPEIRYARARGDVHVAYQTFGDGPIVIGTPGAAQNIRAMWDDPYYPHLLERLGSFMRLTQFDKRGTGLSDRSGIGSFEDRMDDFRARSTSPYAPACTPARSRIAGPTSAASFRSTSPPASRPRRPRARCSSPPRCAISSPARVSASTSAASVLQGCRA
jgi:hypothetical protein